MVAVSREGAGSPAVSAVYHEADYGAYLEAVADSFARLDSIAAEEAAARAAEEAAARAAADSLAAVDSTEVADTTAAGGGEVPPDSAVVDPQEEPSTEPPEQEVPTRRLPASLPPPQGAPPGPMEGTDRVIPGRRIVLVMAAPLEYDVEYLVRVEGAVNINRLSGGGG